MKLSLLFLFAVILIAGRAEPLDLIENLCTPDKVCFSSPKGCETEDCDVVISFTDNETQIYMNDIKDYHFMLLYIDKTGLPRNDIFVCFSGTDKCFFGIEPPGKLHSLTKKQNTIMDIINENNGAYMFTFPRVILDTGDNVTYSFRDGEAGVDVIDAPSTPLFHVNGTDSVKNLIVSQNGEDVKDIHTEYESLEAMEPTDRSKRLVAVSRTLRNVNLDEVIANRFRSSLSKSIF
ncbi:unnamed protein product [Caenorhabditis sp. 36 PRJEB53466]|nr:unnamed protein product [Caenorhabditis sp. 36 PRJEB53466]